METVVVEYVLEERSITWETYKCPLLNKKWKIKEGNVIKVNKEQGVELKVLTGPERLGRVKMRWRIRNLARI